MKIYIVTESGKTEVENLFSVKYVSSYDAPADGVYIYLKLPDNTDVHKVELTDDNGDTVFVGYADLVKRKRDKDFIFARSMMSLLLDSQSEPMTLLIPTTKALFTLFCKKFGELKNALPEKKAYESYEISRGESAYKAINDFASTDSITNIAVNQKGEVFLPKISDNTVDLSIYNICDLEVIADNTVGVDRINYKISNSEGYIRHYVKNIDDVKNVKREKYLNLSIYPAWQREDILKNAFIKSQLMQDTAVVTFIGAIDFPLYTRCRFEFNGKEYEDYIITSKTITGDKRGTKTQFKLSKYNDFKGVNYVD